MKFTIAIPPQIKQLAASLAPIARHHYFIFLLALLIGLLWASFTVSQILTMPPDSAYQSQKEVELSRAQFDQDTIKRIEALQRSNEGGSVPPTASPGARTNPFAE